LSGSQTFAKVVEKNIINKQHKIDEIKAQKLSSMISKMDFETALSNTLIFLQNPASSWINGDIKQKSRINKLIFLKPIAYNKERGFETTEMSIPFKVTKKFSGSESRLVEMAGIEPASENLQTKSLHA